MKVLRFVLCLALLAAAGCYHATVETGLPASTQVVSQKWASGWILGLVPPKTVAAASMCPNGVARVETQLSFLNQVVRMLTIGIYSPMEIRVTCASSGMGEVLDTEPDLIVAHPEDPDSVRETFQAAAQLALTEHRPVYVQL